MLGLRVLSKRPLGQAEELLASVPETIQEHEDTFGQTSVNRKHAAEGGFPEIFDVHVTLGEKRGSYVVLCHRVL